MDRPAGQEAQLIGTLRNLPNVTLVKQSPYVQCKLTHSDSKVSALEQKTKTVVKGGQHPDFDHEMRFKIYSDKQDPNKVAGIFDRSGKGRKLIFTLYAEEPRKSRWIADTTLQLEDIIKQGEHDAWHEMKDEKSRYAGEIFIECTYYSNAKPPPKPSSASNNNTYNKKLPGGLPAEIIHGPGNTPNTTVPPPAPQIPSYQVPSNIAPPPTSARTHASSISSKVSSISSSSAASSSRPASSLSQIPLYRPEYSASSPLNFYAPRPQNYEDIAVSSETGHPTTWVNNLEERRRYDSLAAKQTQDLQQMLFAPPTQTPISDFQPADPAYPNGSDQLSNALGDMSITGRQHHLSGPNSSQAYPTYPLDSQSRHRASFSTSDMPSYAQNLARENPIPQALRAGGGSAGNTAASSPQPSNYATLPGFYINQGPFRSDQGEYNPPRTNQHMQSLPPLSESETTHPPYLAPLQTSHHQHSYSDPTVLPSHHQAVSSPLGYQPQSGPSRTYGDPHSDQALSPNLAHPPTQLMSPPPQAMQNNQYDTHTNPVQAFHQSFWGGGPQDRPNTGQPAFDYQQAQVSHEQHSTLPAYQPGPASQHGPSSTAPQQTQSYPHEGNQPAVYMPNLPPPPPPQSSAQAPYGQSGPDFRMNTPQSASAAGNHMQYQAYSGGPAPLPYDNGAFHSHSPYPPGTGAVQPPPFPLPRPASMPPGPAPSWQTMESMPPLPPPQMYHPQPPHPNQTPTSYHYPPRPTSVVENQAYPSVPRPLPTAPYQAR